MNELHRSTSGVGRTTFLLLVAALLLSGCTPARGHRFDYSRALLTIQCPGPGNRTVALAVHDVRKYIVNARHTPNYIGISRAILGNPWPIYTADDAPLTTTITQGLADALRKAGYSPLISGSRPTDTRQDVINALKSSRADRIMKSYRMPVLMAGLQRYLVRIGNCLILNMSMINLKHG